MIGFNVVPWLDRDVAVVVVLEAYQVDDTGLAGGGVPNRQGLV